MPDQDAIPAYTDKLRRDGVVHMPSWYGYDYVEWLRQLASKLAFQIAAVDTGDVPAVSMKSGKFGYDANLRRYGVIRLYQINRMVPDVNAFSVDPYIARMIDDYYYRRVKLQFTIAQYNYHGDEEQRGWHIDSAKHQFKAFLYLSDVGEANGPLGYVRGSHKPSVAMDDVLNRVKQQGVKERSDGSRPSDVDIELLGEPTAYPGIPGDVVLADTRGAHRGMPVAEAHSRLALVNYYVLK